METRSTRCGRRDVPHAALSALGRRTGACLSAILLLGILLCAGGKVDKNGKNDRPPAPPTIADLEKDLKASRPETRKSAVKKLADLDTRESWSLVMQALADADGQVADEAEIALGRAREPHVVRELCERGGLASGDPWITLRAAEALGRIEVPFDARALLRCATPQGGDLARTALWSIERQVRARRALTAPQVGKYSDQVIAKLRDIAGGTGMGDVRGAALLALMPLEAFVGHDAAVAALKERDEAVRCAGVVAAGSFSEQECLTLSKMALDDASERVRVAAIHNLGQQKSRAAMLALVDRLEHEERSRLRYEILKSLREMSGEDHGFDLAAWRACAQNLQGAVSTGDPRDRAETLGDSHVSLAGLNLLSDRVAFLIDLSGSMWDTLAGERTRKEVVDAMLRNCLESLPREAEFNLFPYTRDPIPWEKHLVRATGENVSRAATWFERCHQRGPGNVYDAILLALSDPEVDTLVILTDGKPTGGHRFDLELMVELLIERNRFRQVAFDSILVETPKPFRRMWSDLAERTGGRSIAVEDLAAVGSAQDPRKPPK
jgi:HEAT repeat protein